jgi:hypothetical protein
MKRKLTLIVTTAAAFAVCAAVALAVTSPTVETGSATNVKEFSATLRGIVRPNGDPTTYQFRWGLTTAYGVLTPSRGAGHGTKAVDAKADLDHLLPGTTYHYLLVATSKAGQTIGGDHALKTKGKPPAVASTGPATQPGTNSITLTGVVYPNGEATRWYFKYGTTLLYGQNTAGGTVPAGTQPVTVTQPLTGLQSGEIFHYQLVAVNRGVPSNGADGEFMTFPSPAPVPKMTSKTSPGSEKGGPYLFTTSGHLSGPSSIPSGFACGGEVAIHFLLGRKAVGTEITTVTPSCTFSGQTIFKKKPGRGKSNRTVHLHVVVNYRGDGYLAVAKTKPQKVTIS